MVELADASGSKSDRAYTQCGFDSPLGTRLMIKTVLMKIYIMQSTTILNFIQKDVHLLKEQAQYNIKKC